MFFKRNSDRPCARAVFVILERMKKMKKKNLYWIVESALMIAVAIVLEVVSKTFIPEMPFGGQITAASMMPIILVGWKYGIGRGLITGLAYSMVEMLIGIKTVSAVFMPDSDSYLGGLGQALLMVILDYVVAFTVLGLGAMYKKAFKSATASLTLGTFTVILLRYISHTISGFILYGAYAEWFFTQEGFYSWGQNIINSFSGNALAFIYSVIYNGFYMIPELIITTIGAVFVSRISALTKVKE